MATQKKPKQRPPEFPAHLHTLKYTTPRYTKTIEGGKPIRAAASAAKAYRMIVILFSLHILEESVERDWDERQKEALALEAEYEALLVEGEAYEAARK